MRSSSIVPRSSSLTKDLPNPVTEPKNTITHINAEATASENLVSATENTTIDTVVRANRNTVEIVYLFLSSSLTSFANTANSLFISTL